MTASILIQQFINGLSVGFGYALIALSLTLAFGVLHVINFGHGEIVMLGALTTVIAHSKLGVPYLAALPLAVLVGLAAGWLFNRVAVQPLMARPEGRTDVLLTTFAVGVLTYQVVFSAWGPAPARVDGIEGVLRIGPAGGELALSGQRLFVMGASLVSLFALRWLLKHTRFGVEMRAVAQSEAAARIVGIDVRRIGARTFWLASSVAGFGGALLAPITSYSPTLGQAVLIKAFVIVVIGGLGSVAGAVVCALGVGVLEAMLGLVMQQEMATALVYSFMVLVLLVRPQGLAGARA